MRRALVILALWPGLALAGVTYVNRWGASCAQQGSGGSTCAVSGVTTSGAALLLALVAEGTDGAINTPTITGVSNASTGAFTAIAGAAYDHVNTHFSVRTFYVIASGALTGQTFTATWASTSYTLKQVVIVEITGHDGAVPIGATAQGDNADFTTTYAVPLTPTATGSLVFTSQVQNEYSGAASTANGSSTLLYQGGGSSTRADAFRSSGVTTSGVQVSVGSADVKATWAGVAVEIVPGGGAPPPSGPANSGLMGFWGMLLVPRDEAQG